MLQDNSAVGEEHLSGLVTRLQAGFHTVKTKAGIVSCKLRGRLKRGPAEGDIVAVGDLVKITRFSDGTGVIEEVMPRQKALVRMDPRPRGEYQQVLLSNPDQVVLVFSCAQPAPRLRMLDRFLVISEKQEIPALIVVNKIDLVGLEEAQDMFSIYPPIGYELLFTSALTGHGVEQFYEHLVGKISALAGPSGAGKSSLLNAAQPHLGLAVREVSQLTSKGRHTTVVREMFPLEDGGYVADMPGLRSLALWDMEPEELDGYFPELCSLVEHCKFNDCTHQMEPECAVVAAVEAGEVHNERYVSYLRMRFGDE
jgi:ribosome biogenesis GTPase